jgi:hypothetical protein
MLGYRAADRDRSSVHAEAGAYDTARRPVGDIREESR